jgi:hypothetical protein
MVELRTVGFLDYFVAPDSVSFGLEVSCSEASLWKSKQTSARGTITGMNQAPTTEQIISTLMYQLVVGQAHLAVVKGLANSDPVVLNSATVFFGMSIDSHLYSAQMHAARLYDDTHKEVTVKTLLERAGKEKTKYGSASEVKKAIADSEKKLSELAGPLKALANHRNTRLAHTDPRTITDPVKVAAAAGTSFPDLQKIFKETGNILNELSRLYRDTTGSLEIIGQEDYKTVIEFVSDAKCRQIKQYEDEFHETAPFPKPEGCK